MRVFVIAVGRARGGKAGPEGALFAEYTRRLAWPVTVREVEERRKLPPADRKRREGELLLAALPHGARRIVLDARGRTLSSEDFAARLSAWEGRGAAALAFVIGGADGLAPAVLEGADLVLSLGPMTWPHLLVRAMLAEQLYRAQAILQGHPYHRG
ncbi:MAG: 23S rRNA (pseudouridine(1915)-N(3))-methyltransferase RlmH [Proteobacteria bacterium]|nr:23S rRNA (pseudouridine(1915)-N(3))-methyltransferase RlmH [Pseudomonadota bacterium]